MTGSVQHHMLKLRASEFREELRLAPVIYNIHHPRVLGKDINQNAIVRQCIPEGVEGWFEKETGRCGERG